jgi:hypothetical protein
MLEIKSKYAKILTLILSIGVVVGKSIDRTVGRNLDIQNFIFFDRFLTPDGALYLERSLFYLGFTRSERLETVTNFYMNNSFEITSYILEPDLWEKSLVYPRILYPVVSSFFIHFFGPIGSLVTPIIIFILIPQIMITMTSNKNTIKLSALSMIILFTISFYVKYNLLANTTESLTTLILLLIYRKILQFENNSRSAKYLNSIYLALLSLLLSMTRQNEIFVFIILITWIAIKTRIKLTEKLKLSLPAMAIVLIWLYLSVLHFGNYSNLTNSSGETVNFSLITLLLLLTNLMKIFFIENLQLWVNDQALFILVCYYAYSIKKYNWNYEKILTLLIYSFGFILTGINGSLGSGYRYILPILPILIVYSIKVNSNGVNR